MKKLNKILSIVLATIMMSLIMVGCGEPKIKPEEVVKIALDAQLKGDKSQIDKIGMTEEDFNSSREQVEKSMTDMLQTTSLKLSDEEMEEFKNNILEGMSKITYEVGEAKIDKDNATVTVNIKGMNMKEISNKSAEALKAKISENPKAFSNQDELLKASVKEVGNQFKDPVLVTDGQDVEFKFVKEKNEWKLKDSSVGTFVGALCRM